MISVAELLIAAHQPAPPHVPEEVAREMAQMVLITGRAFARFAADQLDMDYEAAWHGIAHVPNEMLPLLATREGWTALGDRILNDLGHYNAGQLIPTLH